MNLMINGIDAMKAGTGRRELAISRSEQKTSQVLVSVSDTGVGLPPQRADQIFMRSSHQPHGTGMGLRICRSILESHGGPVVGYRPISPRGANFYITLRQNRGTRMTPAGAATVFIH